MSKALWKKIQQFYGIPADGIPGPVTAATIAQSLKLRKTSQPPRQSKDWPKQTPSRDEIIRFFGEPGLHQVRLKLPYPMVLSWDCSHQITSFACHEKVHDSLAEIFRRTLDHYGFEKIKKLGLHRFGGCLNVRPITGGTVLSTHSWGISVDLWPEANRYSWNHSRARFAREEYDFFWTFVEAEGAVSLGRVRDKDWMHFQFANL